MVLLLFLFTLGEKKEKGINWLRVISCDSQFNLFDPYICYQVVILTPTLKFYTGNTAIRAFFYIFKNIFLSPLRISVWGRKQDRRRKKDVQLFRSWK